MGRIDVWVRTETAIARSEAAVEATPGRHQERARSLGKLGNLFVLRYLRSGNRRTWREALRGPKQHWRQQQGTTQAKQPWCTMLGLFWFADMNKWEIGRTWTRSKQQWGQHLWMTQTEQSAWVPTRLQCWDSTGQAICTNRESAGLGEGHS